VASLKLVDFKTRIRVQIDKGKFGLNDVGIESKSFAVSNTMATVEQSV
jgi:hypothetical protein